MTKRIDPVLDARITVAEPGAEISAGDASRFSMIRQDSATNTLAKTVATDKNTTIDEVTGTATIKRGNLTLMIPNYRALADWKISTAQLFDQLMMHFTANGLKSPEVRITQDEYMERRGLKDRKEAKKQEKADLEILAPTRIDWEEMRDGKLERYGFINLADSGNVERNGDIVFTFGATFSKKAKSYSVMPYPDQLQRINGKRNPYSYAFLRKISEHKYMNAGKENEDIISVQTLLDAAETMPTYEEVKRTDRAFSRRIIEPFERDMDAIAETLTWEYCHSKGVPLTDAELKAMDYQTFSGLLIHVMWNSYPDQTKRLERKAARIEAAKQKTGGNGQQKRTRKKKSAAEK